MKKFHINEVNGRTNDVSYKYGQFEQEKGKRIDKREKGKRSRRKKEIIAGEIIISGREGRVGELAASQKRGD